jgi:hypothetical protein
MKFTDGTETVEVVESLVEIQVTQPNRGVNWPFPDFNTEDSKNGKDSFIPEKWLRGVCTDKQHKSPLMMSIPAGKTVEWHCPTCGHVSFVFNNDALF